MNEEYMKSMEKILSERKLKEYFSKNEFEAYASQLAERLKRVVTAVNAPKRYNPELIKILYEPMGV